MCQVDTLFKARTHDSSIQTQIPLLFPALDHHQPVQSNVVAMSPDLESTEMTVAPPPPPRIVDMIPQIGPHYASQRVWVKVQNLPRGDSLHYLISFGDLGTVSTSFVSSEGDQVQILECMTPITSTPCFVHPSLMHDQIPIGFSDIHYTFFF
jgi:hypothetical protein